MTDMSNSPIGKSIARKEDFRFLTGVGQYTDDVVMPRQTYAAFVRSPPRAWWPCSPAPTCWSRRSAGCPAAG